MEEKQAEFLSFCIESYKAMMGGISGFEEFGAIDYLLENYDDLHKLDHQKLLDQIKKYLDEKGA